MKVLTGNNFLIDGKRKLWSEESMDAAMKEVQINV